MRSTWKTVLMLAALALIQFPGVLTAGEPPLRWESAVADGLKRARAEKRLVLVDFWRDLCPWCDRLDRETFADERVLKALGEVVAVKAKNTENVDAVRQYSVEAFPTIVMLDPEGQPIEVHSGFMPPQEFLAWLNSNKDRYHRLASLKERIQKDPRDLRAQLELGRLHSGDGKWEEARKCFEEVIRADPEGKRRECAEAQLETALTWKRSRQYSRALEHFVKAKKIAFALQADTAEPGKKAAGAEAPAGKAAEAPKPAAPGAGAPPRPNEAMELLDRVLHEIAATQLLLGRREALIETLEEYDAKVSPPDPRRHSWVLLQLGQAKKKTGDVNAARIAFRRCDELYPRSSEARECREELASLK